MGPFSGRCHLCTVRLPCIWVLRPVRAGIELYVPAGGLLGSGGTVYLSQTSAADHLRLMWQAKSGWQPQWQHQQQQPSSSDKDVEDLRQMVRLPPWQRCAVLDC